MSESSEQTAVFQWAEWMQGRYPELRWMFHIPNGGSRNKAEASRLKSQGVKAGVADIFLPCPRGDWHGLWIELKVGTNKPTEKQVDFLKAMGNAGYSVAVCYGAEEAISVIKQYLGGNDGRSKVREDNRD